MNIRMIEEFLSDLPTNCPVVLLEEGTPTYITLENSCGSYRGYYDEPYISATETYHYDSIQEINSDIFECGFPTITVGQFRKLIGRILSEEFRGYKGGEYEYTGSNRLFFASYGSTGLMAIGIKEENGIVYITCMEDY